MPKISLSLPGEILRFVDSLGTNRSKAIVTILQEFQKQRQNEALLKAYDDYEAFCREDDQGWWADWEQAAAHDLGRDPQ